ncbi:MAG: hypothetical protein MJE66_01765 [Proteobacteria bacterium]|nr:hypothetical protein [Pseudomonadota bacterium]
MKAHDRFNDACDVVGRAEAAVQRAGFDWLETSERGSHDPGGLDAERNAELRYGRAEAELRRLRDNGEPLERPLELGRER